MPSVGISSQGRPPSPTESTRSISSDASDQPALRPIRNLTSLRYGVRGWIKPGIKRDLISWASICILGSVLFITLLYVLLFIKAPASRYSVTSKTLVFGDPTAEDGKPVDEVSRWINEYSRSVIPLMCHSHNDYWRPYPLFSALTAGCTGIEADVWLTDDGQDLLVGHNRGSLSPNKTLKSMYLDPLLDILNRRNPDKIWANHTLYDHAHGVFNTQPNTPVVLMIDVKEKPTAVWPIVLRQLEPFRQKRFLRRYEQVYPNQESIERQTIWPGPLVVVGSGALDLDALHAAYPDVTETGHSVYYDYHDTFLDAPLNTLPEVNTFRRDNRMSVLDSGSTTRYSADNSYYASVSFKVAIGSVKFGFSKKQLETLRTQIRTAKSSGLVSRYWDIPDWPINYRDYTWEVLTREGVGMLNVDDIESAARRPWTKGYIGSVIWMTTVSVYVVILSVVIIWVGHRVIKSYKIGARRQQHIYLV